MIKDNYGTFGLSQLRIVYLLHASETPSLPLIGMGALKALTTASLPPLHATVLMTHGKNVGP